MTKTIPNILLIYTGGTIGMIKDPETGASINKHRNVENLGYLFDIAGIKIFHCGDANPMKKEEYVSLKEEKVDIAFLDRAFVSRSEGLEVINDLIDPGYLVLMHINPGNKALFAAHFKEDESVLLFEEKMGSRVLEIGN